MKTIRHPHRGAVLITEAPVSADQEFSSRRRRYLVMMLGRALCVIGAVLTFNISGLLAAAFLIGAAVLPWAAVLLANNRPAKQAMRFRRFLPADDGPAQLAAPVSVPRSSRAEASGSAPARESTVAGDETSGPDPEQTPSDRRVIDL